MDNDFRSDAREGVYALGGNIMLGAIVTLFAVVVFLIALHFYARWYLLRARRRNRQRANRIVFYVDPNAAAPTSGLDPSLLTSLPVFTYSSKTHPEALECAVCLSEFEDNEKGRLLPKCQHSFHVDCIDMWFHSHSSCPICRSPVEPDIPVHSPRENQTDHVVLSIGDPGETEPGSSSGQGVCSTCQHDRVPIGSTTSLVDRRKGLSLDVTIEVPRMSESEGESRLSSPASQGFKSPGNRLLSLKRILSFNRKTLAVSPSSEIGTSCGHEVSESSNESTHDQTPAQTPR